MAYQALIPLCCLGLHAAAGEVYRPITATMTDRTITLTGHDLTIEQLVDIARHGAKVVVSAAAMHALWQELKPLANPIPPDGVTADKGVGDLDAVPMLKLMRMRQALDVSRDILGQDLLNASFWMDVRRLEQPDRAFGPGPTAVLNEFRKTIPFRDPPAGQSAFVPRDDMAVIFLKSNAAVNFYPVMKVAMPQ
jgi:histidine ammonia-lyase